MLIKEIHCRMLSIVGRSLLACRANSMYHAHSRNSRYFTEFRSFTPIRAIRVTYSRHSRYLLAAFAFLIRTKPLI